MNTFSINSYRFGRMEVNGKVHGKDLIILPDRIESNWWRKDGHRLDRDDLRAVFEVQPEVLVVGTGAFGRMTVPAETRAALEAANIDLDVAATGEAWKRFNALSKSRRTAGAFHLTC